MPAFVLAPLVLAAVLGVSAWAKARAVASTTSVLGLLRLPNALQQRWVALALPWGEGLLAAAILLAPAGAPQVLAAALTLVLMASYWVVVARAMTFRPRPSCGCFGDIGDQRITGRTLARNSVLVGLAVTHLAWALDGGSVLATLTDGVEPVLWVAGAAVASLVTWFVTVRPATTTRRLDEPAAEDAGATVDDEPLDYVRATIPAALVTDASGRNHTLLELAAERAQLLLVVNCYCGTSVAAVRAWPGYRERLPQLDVRFVFSGVEPSALTDDLDLSAVWSDHGGVMATTLGLTGSPTAVLLGVDGLLAGGPVTGNDEVDAFVEEIAEAFADHD